MNMTAPAKRESIVIGNSTHPVSKLVTSLLARPVPNRPELWYVRTVDDTVTITYRPGDATLCFYPFGFDQFKEHVKLNTLPNLEVVSVPDYDKYFGNTILAELLDRQSV